MKSNSVWSHKEFVFIYIKLLIADKGPDFIGSDFNQCYSFQTCRGMPDKTQTSKIQTFFLSFKIEHNLIRLE